MSDKAPRNNSGSTRLKTLLRGIVGLGLIALIIIFVDVQQLMEALSQIALLDIAVLLLLSVALISVSVLKWSAFLAYLGISSRFEKLFGLYLVGYFVNTFMPSFVGGDVVRSLALGRGVNRAHAVAATVLERYTGIVAMLLMAGVASFFSQAVTTSIAIVVFASIALCVVATWFVVKGFLKRLVLLCRFPEKFSRVVDSIHEGLMLGARDSKLLRKTFALSILFHLLTVVNTVAVAHAIGWSDVPWRGLLVVVPLILLVGAIPLSPQGLGIQEGAFVFFLNSVGATSSQALAIALVLRAKSYVLAVLGALVWWLRKDAWSAEKDEQSSASARSV